MESSDLPLRLSRGDVVLVRLDPTSGAEQAGERPAIVLSPDVVNMHAPVVLVAPLTTRKTERIYPFEALVEPPNGGITLRSKVMLLQMRGIDRSRVTGRLGSVTGDTMDRIDSAIRVVTGLTTL